MRSRFLAAAVGVFAGAAAAGAQPPQSPLHGSLVSGPHAVGYTTVRLADPARPRSPAVRSRGIVVHVWYPAVAAAQPPLTFGEAAVAHLPAITPEAVRAQHESTRRFMSQFGAITDESWQRLVETPLLSRRDAPPAEGRFPLVIGQLRPLSTQITSEYLASHGYVVAMTHGEPVPEARDAGPGLDIAYRDMEFAIAGLRKLPYVHDQSLAALGFSGVGFSQILLAMRHPDVRAVCDLESAVFDSRMMWPLASGFGYDVLALRVPFLHTYSVPLSAREDRIADFERMRYSTRYRYLVDAPGIHHWDFATEGMAASTVLQIRGGNAPRLRQAFETTNRYVLAFFDAYVKGDAAGLAFLRRTPEANGAPAGLATIRELPGVPPAPTSDEFTRMVEQQGVHSAMAAFDAARRQDPEGPLFREAELNRVAYRLLQQKQHEVAIALFRRVVELYPKSANACDSLGEALEATGDRDGALTATRRGLQLLATVDLAPERQQQLRELLQARLKRLGG